MSSIPPIPPGGLPSVPPTEAPKARGEFPKPAAPSGDLGVSPTAGASVPPSAEVGAVERRVIEFVADARSKGLEGDNLVNHVVQRELSVQFGPAATPEMCQAVASQFRSDPVLMGLFYRMTS